MRSLILPDVHDRISKALEVIDREPHDQLIFLGDFFDDWHTGPQAAAETAGQVKLWLDDPDTTCLLGNHDLSYGFTERNEEVGCAGWSIEKFKAIRAILSPTDFERFPLHCWLEGRDHPWLLSHAGIHPTFLAGGQPLKEEIDSLCAEALRALYAGEMHPLLQAGRSRGGLQRYGGINWMDWSELIPIPGLNQLVGHTQGREIRSKDWPNNPNLCIDTTLRHYAVFSNDGVMEIKSYEDLMKGAA